MMDQEAKLKHRLAAIMATDVVGYSKLMQVNETAALAQVSAIRNATQEKIELHQGRIANTAGDSVLAEFGSAVEAVSCALALQQELSSRTQKEDLQVRIGIHLGDVVDKAGDLFGTAVNIAARLEGIAQPGSIVVSSAVRDAIAGKLPVLSADLGPQNLKNIDEPLRAFALMPNSAASPSVFRSGEALPLPSKPSIAVLPFENLSGDREQEYFADGIVEEIITSLSRMHWLFVIARNSSFAYKGRAVDMKQVGRELGVRYLLEGSVRKSGGRIRIIGQLINAATGTHLWADRFDGSLEDIFDLQDQVAASVVGALAPRLEQAEIERVKSKPTENLDAYDYYLRGLAAANRLTKEANEEALRMFYGAMERDPDFVWAYARAAHCYSQRKMAGWMVNRTEETVEAARLARRAIEIGRDDAIALCFAGISLGYMLGKVDDGAAFVDQALALDDNMAIAWNASSWLKLCQGKIDIAIDHGARGLRLSPLDTSNYLWCTDVALAQFCAGRYDDAASWAEAALREQPDFAFGLRVLAASYAMLERPEAAHSAIGRLHNSDPQLRVSNLGDVISPLQPEHRARYIEALKRAGLPE
jgi:TolB-like protein/class 3 adenylate cyclase